MAVAGFAIIVWYVFFIYSKEHPASIDTWIEDVRRPGYIELARAETPTHWFAFFRTNDGRLAMTVECIDWNTWQRRTSKVTVADEAGLSVYADGWRLDPLYRRIGPYLIHDGDIVDIKPNYRGPIHVIYQSPDGSSNPHVAVNDFPVVLEIDVPWDEDE